VVLRIRSDRPPHGEFPCPECGVALHVHRRMGEHSEPWTVGLAISKAQEPLTTLVSRSHRPVIAAAAGAVLLLLLFVGWLISGSSETKPPVVVVDPPVQPDVKQPEPVIPPPVDTLSTRLISLGERITRFHALHDRFPQAAGVLVLPEPSQRLSWFAELELDLPDFPSGRRPVRDRPWNDPANEPFVGRQVPAFLDPASAQVVGQDGRPVSHVVGVAGVGRDAPELERQHPRAGIFGWTRTVRPEDVRDGLSATLMVLGVESQRGSWAEPGRSTVRGLTAPPYVRGPDGFGTGSDESMLALMADGSVRNLAASIDPLLMRRMAAMADGFPLDANIPGEPGDRSPEPSRFTGFAVAQADPESPPVSALQIQNALQLVTIVRPSPTAVLALTLGQFQQTKPVSRRTMLTVMEDLFDRPLRFPKTGFDAADKSLEQTITLNLTETSVEQVLTEILAGTDIGLVIDDATLLIERRSPGAPAVRISPKSPAE
jgi:hypothetical protein